MLVWRPSAFLGLREPFLSFLSKFVCALETSWEPLQDAWKHLLHSKNIQQNSNRTHDFLPLKMFCYRVCSKECPTIKVVIFYQVFVTPQTSHNLNWLCSRRFLVWWLGCVLPKQKSRDRISNRVESFCLRNLDGIKRLVYDFLCAIFSENFPFHQSVSESVEDWIMITTITHICCYCSAVGARRTILVLSQFPNLYWVFFNFNE